MFIEDTEMGFDNPTHIKRYSVIGNDSSFKQYTKNHAYYDVQPVQEPSNTRQSVLSVSIKEVEEHKEHLKKMKNYNETVDNV